jgi:signal transduction histidine kinase
MHARRARRPEPDRLATVLSAVETGLPWTLAASLQGGMSDAGLESRRRVLLGALGAVLMLVAAGAFVIVRARRNEMALARLQSDFVTAVSHEFRTPLTLRQFNELLDQPDALAPEKRRSYHQAQTRATERLHRLVESLLDLVAWRPAGGRTPSSGWMPVCCPRPRRGIPRRTRRPRHHRHLSGRFG